MNAQAVPASNSIAHTEETSSRRTFREIDLATSNDSPFARTIS